MNTIQSSLADFTNILVSDDKHVITPRDYNKLHKDDVTFISNSVMSAKSAGTQSVVVLTHFPPSSNGTFDPAAMSPVIKYLSFPFDPFYHVSPLYSHSIILFFSANAGLSVYLFVNDVLGVLISLTWNMFWVLP